MASSSHTLINSGGDGEVATRVYKAAVCPTCGVTRRTVHLGRGPRVARHHVSSGPVTIFGAKVPVRQGSEAVEETLRWLAAGWSDVTVSSFDLVAADVSEDLAYVIGFEHIANSVAGVPVEPYTLRATHVYRRENGVWKMAHRHADRVPEDQTKSQGSPPG